VSDYYPECARAVKEATGAAYVFPFDHNVRSAAAKKEKREIVGGNAVQSPAFMVHGDYTLTSAPQRLLDLAKPPKINDTLRQVLGAETPVVPPALAEAAMSNTRWAIVNIWRSIGAEPVQDYPLAMCSARSVKPEDLVVMEIHYADRIGENYFAKHHERHEWQFFPEMTRDEVLLLKTWDSAGGLARSSGARGDGEDGIPCCTFSFHSAFQDLAAPADAPTRQSIEVRCLVVYELGSGPPAAPPSRM